ncbi:MULTISPECIES: iron ABC transporter permease [Lactobacillus]|uniref:FecCD family ABC transporter permease n=1 Tax=Lactobacillus TaxID=1578 RepID=UPI000CD97F39|nr:MULTISPECIES: iron ABC transporter permease [Lactobacillus]RVU72065.1 iron ABC transporter permease [Lactobacillus xujianguonis]
MKKRIFWTYCVLTILLIGTCYFAITHGASKIAFSHLTQSNLNILFNIRLPRIISALVAGAALSASGAFFQAALRNPIASPGIMGISSASSLFQTLALFCLPAFFAGRLIFAVIGGLVAFLLLLKFQTQMDPYRLIIVGVALNAVFTGIQAVVAPNANSISLATSTWQTTLYLSILGLIGIILTLIFAQWGNYLKVNDEELQSLGLKPAQMRLVLLLLAVVLASVATACVGVFAFIGIIVPQIGRFIVGHDYQELVPFSLFGGAWFLLFVDTLGRTINPPNEISAGVLLAIIGGPFMIAILLQAGRRKHA